MTGRQAAASVGGVAALARLLGVSRGVIYKKWDRIPAGRVVAIERATGIPREALRPDLYVKRRKPRAR